MKKIILCMLVLMLGANLLAVAESPQMDDATAFSAAIDALWHINSRESVESARQILSGITSNYNQANSFRVYAEVILDIDDGNLDSASTKLHVLENTQGFESLRESYGLPSCHVIQQYIEARRLEDSGQYSEAFDIYTSISFLDSMDRSLALAPYSITEEAYQSAIKLFYAGQYREAAEAFDALGDYKDSVSMAQEARWRSTSEPAPTPTPAIASRPANPVSWRSVDWSDKDNLYFCVLVSERYTDADISRLTAWLMNTYSIPCVVTRMRAIGTGEHLYDAVTANPAVVGVLACGFDRSKSEVFIERCAAKDVPVWFTGTEDLDRLMAEIEAEFNGVYPREY